MNIKERIYEKTKTTIVGEAISSLKILYGENKKVFFLEMIFSYIVSIFISGFIILCMMNLGVNDYAYTPVNIISAWIKHGILFSFLVMILVVHGSAKVMVKLKTGYERDEDGNYLVSEDGTYGNAKIMDREDMKKTFNIGTINEMKSTIFGRDPRNLSMIIGQKHPLLKVNRNVFMVAGPSAGKSATFVIPLILQIIRRGESAIISDPKSELFKYLAEFAKLLGYEVRILNLNPMFLDNSDPCNFLQYVGDDVDKAQVVSNAIIANTTGGDKLLDFWTEGALNFVQAIMLRVNASDDYKPEEKNLPQLFSYITENTLEEVEADFDMNIKPDHPAYAPFKIFANGEEKVKKQVYQGIGIKLKLFNSTKLRNILSRTEGGLDILNPGRKKCLYFVGSNDQDSSMSSIVSLFYTLVYQELVRYADRRNDQQLPITVHMVLDEYANMATIPDFEKKLSTVRSRNIVTYIICQDINQLKTKHPLDTWKTVLNDCDYYMMLKTNDPDTMEWWSTMSGEQTIAVKNTRYTKRKTDIFDMHNDEQVTVGQGTKQVLTTHNVRTLKDDELLLLVTQRDIIKLKTFFWKTHPYGKYMEKHKEDLYILPAEHYPLWRLIDDGIVDKDYDYDNEPSFKLELKPDEQIEIDQNYDPDRMLGLVTRKISKRNMKEHISKLKNKLVTLQKGHQKEEHTNNHREKQIKVETTEAQEQESATVLDNYKIRHIRTDDYGRPSTEDIDKYRKELGTTTEIKKPVHEDKKVSSPSQTKKPVKKRTTKKTLPVEVDDTQVEALSNILQQSSVHELKMGKEFIRKEIDIPMSIPEELEPEDTFVDVEELMGSPEEEFSDDMLFSNADSLDDFN